jgi:hypothetical protein
VYPQTHTISLFPSWVKQVCNTRLTFYHNANSTRESLTASRWHKNLNYMQQSPRAVVSKPFPTMHHYISKNKYPAPPIHTYTHIYLFIYKFIPTPPWNITCTPLQSETTVLEKPIVTWLVNNYVIYGNWILITVFRRAHRWSISWATYCKYSPHPISLRLILVLSSLLWLGLPTGFYHSHFTKKFCL